MYRKESDVKEFIGNRYNSLTIIEYIGQTKGYHKLVNVRCDCGLIKKMRLYAVLNDEIKSCGCTQHDHSFAQHLSTHPLYHVWGGMIDRCYKMENIAYSYYGGRGIIVCEEWKTSFKAFYDWAIDKWEPGLELDKDLLSPTKTGKIYSPEFCCFLTRKENCRNKGDNVILTYNGESLCIAEWAERVGLPYHALYLRVKRRGWSTEKALTEPLCTTYLGRS